MRITPVLVAISILLLMNTGHAFQLIADTNVRVSTSTTKNIDMILGSDTKDTFLIRVLEEKSWISLSTNRLSLEANEQKAFSIYFSPGADVMLGTYKITVAAESLSTGLQTEKALFVTIEKGEVVEIEQVVVRGDLIPTGTVDIEVHIKNFKTATATDVPVEIKVMSTHELAAFSDIVERIDPDQTATVRHQIVLERYSPPGTYTVTAKITYGGLSSETRQDFTVVERAVPKSIEETQFFLLGYTRKISVRNYGNVPIAEYTITKPLDGLEKSFFYGTVPTQKSPDSYTWKLNNIEPGDEAAITYTINYAPLAVLIIIICAAAWFIVFKVRTLRIKKYIMQRKTIKEGTEFTIGIEIKNSTGRKINDIVVTDFVPSVFAVKDTHGITAHKLKSGIGTELRWEIKEFVRNDERVLSYKIIPVFGIQGQVKLPSAKVMFRSGSRTKTNTSFAPRLGIRYVKEKD